MTTAPEKYPPTLAAKILQSLDAMIRQVETVIDRHAAHADALAKGTCRELGRVSNGMRAINAAVQDHISLTVAGSLELTPHESIARERLVEFLGECGTSWTQIGEKLAAERFVDEKGREFKRERMILMAISAAGGVRYAHGESDAGKFLFDLFNLPRLVGGLGGLAPIVRSCFNGEPKYGLIWRFAQPADCLTATVVDDDADLEPKQEQGTPA